MPIEYSSSNVLIAQENSYKWSNKASYNVSFLITKRSLQFNVGETLVVPATKNPISTLMERDLASVLQTDLLSDTLLKRRIDEMGTNIEDQLCEFLRTTYHIRQ